jgi:hypothetical protein
LGDFLHAQEFVPDVGSDAKSAGTDDRLAVLLDH